VVRELEKVERAVPTLSFVLPTRLELHPVGLLRMNGEREMGKTLGQDRQNPTCVIFPLTPGDEI